MLAAMPERELTAGAAVGFFYADLAGQLASVGIAQPASDRPVTTLPDGFFEATIALPLAARAFEIGLDPEWFPTFGFNPYATGQALSLTDPPNTVSVFRGGFDRGTVERALTKSGFVQVRREAGSYFSFGDELALETPVGRLGVGTMNQAIVGDDLLVFSRQEKDVEAALEVLAGAAPSMADQELWTGMVSLFAADTVGLIPVAPALPAPAGGLASPAATPVAPASPLEYLALGVRAGSRAAPLALGGEGTPQATPVGVAGVPARVEARLRYTDADTARQEAEAIPARWREGVSVIADRPLDELMTIEDAGVSPLDPRAVAIEFVADTPNRWSQLILLGDLAPFLLPVG
jgi:hypothetical protein